MIKISGIVISVIILSLSIYSNTNNDISWYKCLKGTIGKYPVTMHLHKSDKSVRGFYYYERFRQPIGVFGDVKGDSIQIIPNSNNMSESFYGILKNNRYKGIWNGNNDSTHLDFDLVADETISSMFEYVYVHGTKELFKGWKDSPVGEYTESVFWPLDKYSNAAFIRKCICSEKKFPGNSKVIGELMLKNKNKFLESYGDENKDLKKSEIEKSGNGYMYSVTDEDNMLIAYFDDNLFVISRMYYSYNGGVHGMYGTSFTVYNIGDKKQLKLTDILTDAGIKYMPSLLEKNFRKQYSVDDKMSLRDFGLFVDTINVNDNFCLTPGGMAFNYVPYEISSYAQGEIMIYIPMEEIEKYLQPGIQK